MGLGFESRRNHKALITGKLTFFLYQFPAKIVPKSRHFFLRLPEPRFRLQPHPLFRSVSLENIPFADDTAPEIIVTSRRKNQKAVMSEWNGSRLRGYIITIIGSACYGLNPLFALPLYGEGVTPYTVLFYRYALATLLVGAVMLARRQSFRVSRGQLLPLLCMGALFAGSSTCLFVSFTYIDAGIASVLLFTYPIFVSLISSWLFREKQGWITWASIAVAFGGVCLLTETDGAAVSPAGLALAIASGLTYALYLIGVNRSALRDMPVVTISFYALLTGTAGLGAFCLTDPAGLLLPSATAWFNTAGLALFPTLISMLFVTYGVHTIGSTPAAIIGALEPLTALAVSVLVFGGRLSAANMAGFALVLCAVTAMVRFRK